MLQMRVSPWQLEGIIELNDAYKRGEAAEVSNTVRSVTGKDPATFAQFARDYAGAFETAVAATSA
jgi:hypothetical protein